MYTVCILLSLPHIISQTPFSYSVDFLLQIPCLKFVPEHYFSGGWNVHDQFIHTLYKDSVINHIPFNFHFQFSDALLLSP